MAFISGALGIFHRLCVDDNVLVRPDEGRHHDLHAAIQDRRLERIGSRLAFDHGFGLDNLASHFLRQGRAQRFAVVIFDHNRHTVLKERTTLTQNIRRTAIVSGRARIELEGITDDRPVTLHWSQISDDDTPEPSFRFKYFQQLEGYLTLPEKFSPTRMVVTLEAGERRKPVVRGFDWAELLNPSGD